MASPVESVLFQHAAKHHRTLIAIVTSDSKFPAAPGIPSPSVWGKGHIAGWIEFLLLPD